MGMSTDAIIFYGIDLGDEDGSAEWIENINTDKLDPELADDYADTPMDWLTETLWHGPKRSVIIGSHCSYDYPMHYVCAKDSEKTAWRGHPQNIGALISTDLRQLRQWDHEIESFCVEFGLPYEQPHWYLASNMG